MQLAPPVAPALLGLQLLPRRRQVPVLVLVLVLVRVLVVVGVVLALAPALVLPLQSSRSSMLVQAWCPLL